MNSPGPTLDSAGAIRRFFQAGCVLLLTTAIALARGNHHGTITGRVIDGASKLPLPGVIVSLDHTTTTTTTGQDGDYVLPNLSAGEAHVDFSFLGYRQQIHTVRVTGGRVSRLDVVLQARALQMAQLVVKGTALGTARALNVERSAPTLTNVLASDAIGQLPDLNSAQALARMPGITYESDRGEPRFVIVRGIDSPYVGVSIDGVRVSPSESKGNRNVALDIIPSSMIESIEVTKVSTPDMYPDSMGADIDIRTRTGFDANGPEAAFSASDLYSSQEKRHGYRFEAYYGAPVSPRFGFFVGVQHEYRPFSTFFAAEKKPWAQMKSPTDGKSYWVLGALDLRHYELARVRDAGNASLDYRLGDTGHVYLRAYTAWTIQSMNQQVTTFPFGKGTFTQLDATSGTESMKAIVKSEAPKRLTKRTSGIVAGLDQTTGPWTFHLLAGWTQGNYANTAPTIQFKTSGKATFAWNDRNPYRFLVTQTGGPSINDPASYVFSTSSNFNQTISIDREKTVRADLRNDFTVAGLPAYLKAGIMYRNLNKSINVTSLKLGASALSMAEGVQPDAAFPLLPGGIRMNPKVASQYYVNSAAYDPVLDLSKSLLGDCQATENIAAAYVMGDIKKGKLEIMAGGRVERTHSAIAGWQTLVSTGAITPSVGWGKNYTNAFPDVIFTYRPDSNTVARASFTTNISRPPFASEIPGRTVNDIDEIVTEGNPGLNPLLDTNWDASIEHFSPHLGVLSMSLFYKRIKNFTYKAEQGVDPSTGYVLDSYFNGPASSIKGVDVDWQQRLTFLPSPLDGFGVGGNVTLMSSTSTYVTRPGEKLPFVGMSKVLYNVSLLFEKWGLKLRLAANYYGRRLSSATAIGSNANQDQWEAPWLTWSFGGSYAFAREWNVFLDVDNLFNSPYRVYSGGPNGNHLEAWERYGWSSRLGFRWTY